MSSTSTPYKRGDVGEDGRIFWGYYASSVPRNKHCWWIEERDIVRFYCSRILTAARQRVKKQDIPCTITAEYLLSIFPRDMICPITGKQMDFFGPNKNLRPSLDKVIPHKGYVEGNVVWMSLEANRIKDNADLRVLRNLVRLLEDHLDA